MSASPNTDRRAPIAMLRATATASEQCATADLRERVDPTPATVLAAPKAAKSTLKDSGARTAGPARTTPRAAGGVPADRTPAGTPAPREYRIEIPPRTVLLNANDTFKHWSQKHRVVKNLREISQQLATIQRLPQLERVLITGYLHPPNNQRRDPANWNLTLKACVDGIVSAGVLVDDSSEYVTDGGVQLGVKARFLSFSFTIRELP